MSEDDLMGDAEAMDVDSDDNDSDDRMMGAAPQTPSPERERRMRIAGTSAQRAAAGMILAKQTNMRGQWREGSVLVPVPNARGWPPPADLPVSPRSKFQVPYRGIASASISIALCAHLDTLESNLE